MWSAAEAVNSAVKDILRGVTCSILTCSQDLSIEQYPEFDIQNVCRRIQDVDRLFPPTYLSELQQMQSLMTL